MYTFRILLASLCILSSVLSQEHERGRLSGRALDRSGAPWSNALVSLIARPYPRFWGPGLADEIKVRTDERGRFEARLLPGREYSVWCHSSNKDGGYRLSDIAERVIPFSSLSLQEREDPQMPIRIRVEGLEGNLPHGPLAFRVMSRAARHVPIRALVLDKNGEADLPPMPGSMVFLEALTQSGVCVWLHWVRTTAPARAGSVKRGLRGYPPVQEIRGDKNETSVFHMPKATPYEFSVVSGGKPVKGAGILVCAQSSAGSAGDMRDCKLLARTAGDGQVTIPLYVTWNETGDRAHGMPDVIVRAEGYSDVLYRMMRGLHVKHKQPPQGELAATAKLLNGHVLSGQVMLRGDQPAAGITLLLYSTVGTSSGGSLTSTTPFHLQTDPEGRFRIAGRLDSKPSRITALVHDGEGREERLLFSFDGASPPKGDLGVLRLDRLGSARITVRVNDLPVDRARLYIQELPTGPNTPMQFVTDHVGRCVVRLPTEKEFALFAAHESGFAVEKILIPADGKATSTRCNLQIASTVKGRVLDTQGVPSEGARVSYRSTYPSFGDDWRVRFLREMSSSSTLELQYRLTRTNARGEFRIAFPIRGVKVRVTAWKTKKDGGYVQVKEKPSEFELTKAEHEMEMVLEEFR